MGRWIREALEAQNIATIVIEPNPSRQDQEIAGLIVGRANQENLLKAGIGDAAGIVAGTNNDSDNLSILLNAKALNPNIFLLVRQNRYRNQLVFQATQADFNMMPSLVSARRILFLLHAPLLKTFFEALRGHDAGSKDLALGDVLAKLATRWLDLEPQVGVAGFFIDLAVRDPDKPGRFLLGIECDGATYHGARSARDRDRLREAVLRGLGWEIHRIWSSDWFRNPERETERVLKAMERASSIAQDHLNGRFSIGPRVGDHDLRD